MFSLSLREAADLIQAQVWIIASAWKLRRVQIGNLLTTSSNLPVELVKGSGRVGTISHQNAALQAEQLAQAITRASRFGVLRPACLVRSIALRDLLTARGVSGSVVRVGVRRDEGEFSAHAWVEFDGKVLGDDPEHVARFTPLETLGVRTN